MGLINRSDANHILRNLMVKMEYLGKKHCLHCNGEVFREFHKLLESAEKEIWNLRGKSYDHRSFKI